MFPHRSVLLAELACTSLALTLALFPAPAPAAVTEVLTYALTPSTQPGSRNMPTNARIPIAPPRRDNGDLPAQPTTPKTTHPESSTAAPSSPEVQTEPPSPMGWR